MRLQGAYKGDYHLENKFFSGFDTMGTAIKQEMESGSPVEPQKTSLPDRPGADSPASSVDGTEPEPAKSDSLTLDGTIQDPLSQVHLPEGQQELSTRLHFILGPEQLSNVVEKIETLQTSLQLANEHAHFFSAAEWRDSATYLEILSQQNENALNNGDAETLVSNIEKMNTRLERIEKWISYEKSEGLIGTCADSGVRMYLSNNKIYLCTPDAKAFTDLSQNDKEKLRDFVKGITGVEVDFSSALFQQSGMEDGHALLACRLDELQLKNIGRNQKYTVQTNVRVNNTEFRKETITFSYADLLAGRLSGLLTTNEALSSPTLAGDPISPEMLQKLKDQSLRDAAAAVRIPSPRNRPVPDSALQQKKVRSTPRPLPPKQKGAMTILEQRLRAVSEIDIERLNSPEKLARVIEELDSSHKKYSTALKSRLAHMEKELQRVKGDYTQHRRLQQSYEALRLQDANDVLTRKTLLEKQLTVSGEGKTSTAIKKRLIRLAEEVDTAYETKLTTASLDDAQRQAVAAERSAFSSKVQQLSKEAHGRFGRLTYAARQRLSQAANTKLQIPGTERVKSYIADRSVKATLTKANDTLTLLESEPLSNLDTAQVNKQLKHLERNSTNLRKQITKLDTQLRNGTLTTNAQETLRQLKDLDAKTTIQRAQILEKRLSEASSAKVPQLRNQLYAELATEIEDAYRHLGDEAGAETFKNAGQRELRLESRAGKIERFGTAPRFKEAVRERQKLEAAIKKTAANSTEMLELQSARELARLQEDIILSELEVESLQEQAVRDLDNADSTHKVRQAQAALDELHNTASTQRVKLGELRLSHAKTQLQEIETKLSASDLSDGEKSKLHSQRSALERRTAELSADLNQTKARGTAGTMRRQIAALKQELTQLQSSAEVLTDVTEKAQIERATKSIEQRILQKERLMIKTELEGTTAAKSALEKQLGNVTSELESTDTPAHRKELERTKTQLERKIKGLRSAEEYLEGQRSVIDAESKIVQAERRMGALSKQLQALDEVAELDPSQKTQQSQLREELQRVEKQLSVERNTLKEFKSKFNSAWAERLGAAKSRFDGMLQRKSQWAMENPMKAAMLFGSIAEGLRTMSEADYSANGRHTFLPSLIYMLDGDLDDWIVPVQFTTAESGETMARLAQLSSGAGNAGLVLGGMNYLQKGIAATAGRTSMGATAGNYLAREGVAKTVGRTLSFAGAALDGYLTFSDYEKYANATDEQLFAKTASPIAMGAGFGAFFGPLGAGIGAAGGFVGEAAGVTHSLYKLDAKIENDWQMRGVRDSIKLAENGFVYPENHSALRNRTHTLKPHEQEVIDNLVHTRLLGRMFSGEFSTAELSRMGFKVPSKDMTAAEQEQSGAYNYQRLVELLEEPSYRWVYNWRGEKSRVWGTTNESQKLYDTHSTLARKLDRMRDRDTAYYEQLYHRGTRVEYQHQQKHSTAAVAGNDILHLYSLGHLGSAPGEMQKTDLKTTRELPNLIAETAKYVEQEMHLLELEQPTQRAEAQWQLLAEKLPQLGLILSDDDSRRAFFTIYEKTSGIDLEQSEMWQLKTACPTGIAFCRRVMPSELADIPQDTLAEPLNEIDQLINNLSSGA